MTKEDLKIVIIVIFGIFCVLLFIALMAYGFSLQAPMTIKEKAVMFCEDNGMTLKDYWGSLKEGTCVNLKGNSYTNEKFFTYIEGINQWRFR